MKGCIRSRVSIITLALLVSVFLLVGPALAEPKKVVNAEEIDAVAAKVMKQKNIPGLSIAVSMADGTTITRTYGFAEVEHTVSVQSDSVFPIGSITKFLTALGIMLLQEEGKLSTSDKIMKYFPDYPSGEEITIKHLLLHTSGIKEIGAVEPFKSNQMKVLIPQHLLAILKTQQLYFELGQKAQYSNSGFILLGLIIEKVTGLSYSDFVEQRITKPLGMTNTMMGSNTLIIPRRAAGYYLQGKVLKNAEVMSLSSPYASGGYMSTPTDLVKLRKVFAAGGILKQKSIDEMTTAARLNNGQEYANVTGTGFDFTYGYGMDMLKRGNEFVPGKTGAISGFTSYLAHFRDRGLTVVVFCNMTNTLFDLLEIVRSIAGT